MVRTKESGTGIASGLYITGTPNEAPTPMAWGIPVLVSNSMQQGQFLAGDFNVAAAIWDRNDATVEISREHADFFTRNLAAVLAEERITLTVFREKALIFGGFPFGS
jgi:HK97 family phage major capsid protein